MRVISPHDARELDAFRRYLHIIKWRREALLESKTNATLAACIEVYGDRFGEGNKHHAEGR
jgi:hypothetical protein